MLLHIGAFHLDIDSQHQTPWHRIIPRTRILCALLIVFAIVLTPNGHWLTWAIYGMAGLCLLMLSQITLPVLLKRMLVESAFISVVLLGTLFRSGGQVVWHWGALQITTVGLTILGSVTFKALLSLLFLNVLTLTTSIPALLNALIDLRTPPLLVAILASMYRYLGILVEEFTCMRRAAISRNLLSNPRHQRLIVGSMFGSLFIRTYERGERVHQAMLSRGYQGLPPFREMPQSGSGDIVALTLTALLALLGQAIYLNPFHL